MVLPPLHLPEFLALTTYIFYLILTSFIFLSAFLDLGYPEPKPELEMVARPTTWLEPGSVTAVNCLEPRARLVGVRVGLVGGIHE